MPVMCVPLTRIVNQLTIARKNATAPSRPPSPPAVVVLPLREATPMPKPPTRTMCGIARISRNAVVRRFRPATSGSTVTEIGYGIGADYTGIRDPGGDSHGRSGTGVSCITMREHGDGHETAMDGRDCDGRC